MKFHLLNPITTLDEWKSRVREGQWKPEYSAQLTAESWLSAKGFPTAVQTTFNAIGQQPFSSMEPILAIPEHKIFLTDRQQAPSQPDVWVLAKHEHGLASLACEGKKEEGFGETVERWSAGVTDEGAEKTKRLKVIREKLGLPLYIDLDKIRYQLLHRTAGAVIEAGNFNANVAVTLIQSFGGDGSDFSDYKKFCALFGRDSDAVEQGEPVLLNVVNGIAVYALWVRMVP